MARAGTWYVREVGVSRGRERDVIGCQSESETACVMKNTGIAEECMLTGEFMDRCSCVFSVTHANAAWVCHGPSAIIVVNFTVYNPRVSSSTCAHAIPRAQSHLIYLCVTTEDICFFLVVFGSNFCIVNCVWSMVVRRATLIIDH